ncbi:MAG: DJ-1/PfpI family protein [archaeon]
MRVVFVIAKNGFRDEELFHTKEELEKEKIETVIASTEKGLCQGKLGGTIEAELSIEEISVEEFDAIIFVGGSGAKEYFEDEIALNLAREFNKKTKLVAAICIAPSILANAGLLEGKTVTAFASEKENLTEQGAFFSGEPVEVSGNIVTANGPKAARDFGKKIAELLNE